MSGYEAFLTLLMAFTGSAFLFVALRGWRFGEVSFPIDRIVIGPYRRDGQGGAFWMAIAASLSLAALCFWLIWKFVEQSL